MTVKTREDCDHAPDRCVLASFARRSTGMTGADVEYVVGQARRVARREGRPMDYRDVEEALDAARPKPSEDLRWRFAHHEAGHVVMAIIHKFSGISQITLDDGSGNPSVTAPFFDENVVTEVRVLQLIIVGLAGRASEELFFKVPSIYAGGRRGSDLAWVTKLAYMLETSFGFGKVHQLVYRESPDFVAGIASEPGLLERVNRRLELSYPAAYHLLDLHRDAVEYLAKELMQAGTLDGVHLQEVLKEVHEIIDRKLALAR